MLRSYNRTYTEILPELGQPVSQVGVDRTSRSRSYRQHENHAIELDIGPVYSSSQHQDLIH
jgi:hypothetical protein